MYTDSTQHDAQAVNAALHTTLAHALDNISDAFIILDHDWRITYVNREAARINKKPAAAFLGKSHWEEWPASVGTNVEQQYRKAMAEQVTVHFEHHYFVAGTYDVWLDIYAYPIDNGLAIYYHDISERKQLEMQLRLNETLFQRTLADAPFPMMIHAEAGATVS